MNNYSYSSISGFDNCPRSFEYRYIKNLPEAFRSVEAFMGSVVHSVIEDVFRARDAGMETGPAGIPALFRRKWENEFDETVRIIKDEHDLPHYINLGKELISGYISGPFLSDSSRTISLEEKFEIPLDSSTMYRGIIDRVSRGENGVIRVTDFKTGSVSGPMDNLQLPSYALYIFSSTGEKEIELSIEDLKNRETKTVKVGSSISESTRDELLARIRIIENTGTFPASVSSLCRWCGYNTICPEYLAMTEEDPGSLKYCPDCGSLLVERKGKFGTFLGCTGYPECKYTFDTGRSTETLDASMICPECGGALKKRKGKFGEFLGCSSYPRCRFTLK